MIRSRSNELIKLVRALRQRKARDQTGLFLVEGIHHVGEAVEAGWHIEAILYSPERLKSDFANELKSGYSGRLEVVSEDVMELVAGKDNPQGILAVVRQRNVHLTELPTLRRGAAIVSPQDPGNVGTIIRTLDAVGGDALFLIDGGVDPYHPTAIRAGMGTSFWTPVVATNFPEFEGWRRQQRCLLVGTSAHAEIDYLQWEAHEPWILLLGNEQKGLTLEHLRACDVTLSLPMRGRASSLNLAVAAGVLLYHLAQSPAPNASPPK